MKIKKETHADTAKTIIVVEGDDGRYAGSARINIDFDGSPEACRLIKENAEEIIKAAVKRLNPSNN
nr:MAG TPA: Phycobiliprotein ApcE, ApcE, phycocyanobilin attachment, TRANSFERASE [Caudoviricetes sp.]